MLDQVSITQRQYNFPRYIPIYASTQHGNAEVADWVAVDASILFNFPTPTTAVLKPVFNDADTVRKHLHVTSDCKLIAVLNGKDWMLEQFWAAPRVAILQLLASIGFSACTAPTFSVTELTTESTPVPYSHHTAMLMRHHKVMAEISAAGLCSIPNLYWIDNDRREMARWAEWLRNNPEVYTVSRDFTSTKHWSAIEPKLMELTDMLKLVGRKFHVLIIGTGFSNAVTVMRALRQAGHEVTIVTAAPCHKGLHGSKYIIEESGNRAAVSCDPSEYSLPELIDYNIKVFKETLELVL